MQVEHYGYKWTQRTQGYYQSTTNFPDGTRHWLHQEVYLREVGGIPPFHDVHHKDHDKTNNTPENLVLSSRAAHQALHMQCEERKQTSANNMKKGKGEFQKLSVASRQGDYIGKAKLRKIMKGRKHRTCDYCSEGFILKDTDRNDTRFCCTSCAQRHSKTQRIEGYKPLADELTCIICSERFEPKVCNQLCCSTECQKTHTEVRRKAKNVTRECVKCGVEYETIKSSKRKYCGVGCRKTGLK